MEFEEILNRNWKEWKDLKAKMRKQFDNGKAKHGLITKGKISFGLQNKKGRAKKKLMGRKT